MELGTSYPRYVNDPTLWAQYKVLYPHVKDDTFTTLWPAEIAALEPVFDDWFAAAKANGIIWVQAVGNDGYTNPQEPVVALGDGIPSNRGRRDNELIQVGCAMTDDGTLCPLSSPRGMHVNGVFIQDDNDPRLPAGASLGWVDIYAPGYEAETCSNVDGQMTSIVGSSASTAQVVSSKYLFPASIIKRTKLTFSFTPQAGLASYFLALPEHAQRFAWSDEKNKAMPWGIRMKELMVSLSYQWTDGPNGIIDPNFNGLLPYNLPSMVNVAYNGAYGPMNCESREGQKHT